MPSLSPLSGGPIAGLLVTAGPTTITRPTADVTTTGWTSSTPGPLYADIDEVVADDGDYIISPSLASPTPVTFTLSQTLAAGTWAVRIRTRSTTGSGQIRVVLQDSGGTPVGTSGYQAVTGSFVTYTATVTTSGTAARIQLEVTT